jgi:hypothetical protein
MNKNTIRQTVNVVAVIATLIVNGLANALPLNGLTTGDISDRFDVYFVPAGYVFSIWGLIYIGLIAFAVYQALPAQRENPRLKRIGYLFAASCLANIAWLFLWHYEQFPLTIVAMLALLGLLIAIYLRIGSGRRDEVSTAERWLLHLPFSIYLGWITVATIANVTSLLDYLQWGGWGISEELWMIIMLVVAGGIASAVTFTRRDVAYMLVILWAFVGIALKHAAVPIVATATWIVTVLLGLVLIGTIIRERREKQQPAG